MRKTGRAGHTGRNAKQFDLIIAQVRKGRAASTCSQPLVLCAEVCLTLFVALLRKGISELTCIVDWQPKFTEFGAQFVSQSGELEA